MPHDLRHSILAPKFSVNVGLIWLPSNTHSPGILNETKSSRKPQPLESPASTPLPRVSHNNFTKMPATSTPDVRTKLAPPAIDLIRALEYVAKDRKMRCHAVVPDPNHRCPKSYKPWTEDLEPTLNAIRESKLPFTKENSATFAQILLCRKHRKRDKHVTPLSLALLPVQRSPKGRVSRGWHDDSDLPSNHKSSLNPENYITRGSRSKSAEPDLQTPSSLPDTDPVQLVDAVGELKAPEHVKCIAYDMVTGRCRFYLAKDKLATARRICPSIPVDGESDSEDGDEEYQEDDEDYVSPLSQLRPLIYHLLCHKHRQWFWLEFYYSQWKDDVACDNATGGDSELCSDFEMDTNGSSDQESIQEDNPPDHRGSKSTASAVHTASELPHTPKRPTSKLGKKAYTAPGRVPQAEGRRRTQDDELASFSAHDQSSPSIRGPLGSRHVSADMRKRRSTICNTGTPSISISKAPQSPSLPPSPTLGPRRSPRLAARRSPSYKEVSNRSASEDDLVPCLENLSISSSLNVLSEGWSLRTRLLLYEEVRKPLNDKSETGSLYVAVSTSHSGLVKVGRTTKPPAKRLREIEQDCKLDDLDLIQAFKDVDYHDRVESLAHRHLRIFRELVPCVHKTRVKNHEEWFKCSPELATRVVEAWVEWMKMEPYEEGLLRRPWKGTVQRLKEDPEGNQRETFEQLFQRHKRWMLQ